jgi:hypothetical protein
MSEKKFEVSGDITDSPLTVSSKIAEIEEYKQAEWVFQFDDDEPIVFAWTNGEGDEPAEVNINLKANSQSSIFFASPDLQKRMRIFCREMSDQTREKTKNT